MKCMQRTKLFELVQDLTEIKPCTFYSSGTQFYGTHFVAFGLVKKVEGHEKDTGTQREGTAYAVPSRKNSLFIGD